MAIKKEVGVRKNSVTIELPRHDQRFAKNLDRSQLDTVLSAILGNKRANQALTEIVLKGGTVKVTGLHDPGEVSWEKTTWKRNGPIRPGEELIDPVDLKLPAQGKSKF